MENIIWMTKRFARASSTEKRYIKILINISRINRWFCVGRLSQYILVHFFSHLDFNYITQRHSLPYHWPIYYLYQTFQHKFRKRWFLMASVRHYEEFLSRLSLTIVLLYNFVLFICLFIKNYLKLKTLKHFQFIVTKRKFYIFANWIWNSVV